MLVETFTEVKALAKAKWREYRDAEKKTKGNEPLYTDLKKMYWQIAHGKKLCDITEVLKAGGVHENNCHPKLAVARADAKKVRCTYEERGGVLFRTDTSNQWRPGGFASDVRAVLSPIPKKLLQSYVNNGKQYYFSSLSLEAPVPLIPPQHRPEKLTDDHYILWEVDEWKMVPPTDPYLLRRITKNIFALEAQWDLTPLEKAAMAGRMH